MTGFEYVYYYMTRLVFLLSLLCMLSACRSISKVPQLANEAYYQQQVIPAGRFRALYFYLPLPHAIQEEGLSVKVNEQLVPYTLVKEGKAIEVYLQEQSDPSEDQGETDNEYPALFKARKFSATVTVKGEIWSYPAIRELENPDLPE